MPNEDIAKELLSVLKEKMWYREGLPSDGWAVEVICNALVAAQQSVQPTVLCTCIGSYERPGLHHYHGCPMREPHSG